MNDRFKSNVYWYFNQLYSLCSFCHNAMLQLTFDVKFCVLSLMPNAQLMITWLAYFNAVYSVSVRKSYANIGPTSVDYWNQYGSNGPILNFRPNIQTSISVVDFCEVLLLFFLNKIMKMILVCYVSIIIYFCMPVYYKLVFTTKGYPIKGFILTLMNASDLKLISCWFVKLGHIDVTKFPLAWM